MNSIVLNKQMKTQQIQIDIAAMPAITRGTSKKLSACPPPPELEQLESEVVLFRRTHVELVIISL